MPNFEYCCIKHSCSLVQSTTIGLKDSYHSLASPVRVKQNLCTFATSGKLCVSIQSFVLNNWASASSSGLPANSGLKYNQFNCGIWLITWTGGASGCAELGTCAGGSCGCIGSGMWAGRDCGCTGSGTWAGGLGGCTGSGMCAGGAGARGTCGVEEVGFIILLKCYTIWNGAMWHGGWLRPKSRLA